MTDRWSGSQGSLDFPGWDSLIVHICPDDDWRAALERGEYRPGTLEMEGFIHCSRPDQVLAVANDFYSGIPDLVTLWIDARLLDSELRWEAVDSDEFPHIHGALNLEAVLSVAELKPDQDGVYRNLALG